MRLGKVGQADIADARQPFADHDRRAVEQQAVYQIGAQEGGGGAGAAFDQKVVDMGRGGNLLRRGDPFPSLRRIAMATQQPTPASDRRASSA